MPKKINQKTSRFLYFILFIFTLFSSYYLGVAFYNTTTGVDFGKYLYNLAFFSGDSDVVYDAQGTLYYWSIIFITGLDYQSLLIDSLNNLINNKIQFVNFLYYTFGLFGLFLLLKKKNISNKNIYISFSILNFFPPSYYLRLTMKPEIMAFSLFPWLVLLTDSYLERSTRFKSITLALFFSLIVNIKGSIAGMIILSLFLIYYEEIKNLKKHKNFFLQSLSGIFLFAYLNFKLTGIWLLSKPISIGSSNLDKWNHIADINFFTNISFKNLYQNPFKDLHADSFMSITLLDTLGDYFNFFWKHEERGNYFYIDTIKFTNNFLIQEFIQEYISILFTVIFYFLILYYFIKGAEDKAFFFLPFCGLFVLILNSFGFPNKNFNPETGDLFKVHYYAFLICISFLFLLTKIYREKRYTAILSTLLIPLFLFCIGFPKNISSETQNEILAKLEYTLVCKPIAFIFELDCIK